MIGVGCKSKYPADRIAGIGEITVERIGEPKVITCFVDEKGSFGEFLHHFKLKKEGSKMLDCRDRLISNQSEHVGILDI